MWHWTRCLLPYSYHSVVWLISTNYCSVYINMCMRQPKLKFMIVTFDMPSMSNMHSALYTYRTRTQQLTYGCYLFLLDLSTEFTYTTISKANNVWNEAQINGWLHDLLSCDCCMLAQVSTLFTFLSLKEVKNNKHRWPQLIGWFFYFIKMNGNKNSKYFNST